MVIEDHRQETFVVSQGCGFKQEQVADRQSLSEEFDWGKGRKWMKGRESREEKRETEKTRIERDRQKAAS